ncbi:hypothetical protein [Bradyrhizobium sp. WSM3983]|uniref:hypothetical protein n=1 Tax=Bradyrhizobium sp. WSM3983 TaxID=1038867 RepID=UPI0012EC62FF|nr:hypothetical protein [Bradyrhizobium sp. WSM3983]
MQINDETSFEMIEWGVVRPAAIAQFFRVLVKLFSLPFASRTLTEVVSLAYPDRGRHSTAFSLVEYCSAINRREGDGPSLSLERRKLLAQSDYSCSILRVNNSCGVDW